MNEILEQYYVEKWPVVIYGLGQLASAAGLELLELAGITPDYACDRNPDAITEFIRCNDKLLPLVLEELMEYDEDILAFVCLGMEYVYNAQQMLSSNNKIHIITIDQITAEDSVIERFYNINSINNKANCDNGQKIDDVKLSASVLPNTDNRVAIYTCVTGDYDEFINYDYMEGDCDYYYISDCMPCNNSRYIWLNVDEIVPDKTMSNSEKNRWCKTHGHIIFSEYRYSIYLDGSINLLKDISYYISKIGKSGIALHKHATRDCIYEEGIRIYANKRGSCTRNDICTQMNKYYQEGMPRHYGLFACGVIVRDHVSEIGNMIMEEWFEEYMMSARRDQLSFTYVLWRNGFSIDVIGILNDGEDIFANKDFSINIKHQRINKIGS